MICIRFDDISCTWTQVNHPRRRRSDFVRNGFQRGPQTVIRAQNTRRHRDRGDDDDDDKHHEHPRAKRRRDVPTGPIHFPSVWLSFDGKIFFLVLLQRDQHDEDCVWSENERERRYRWWLPGNESCARNGTNQ